MAPSIIRNVHPPPTSPEAFLTEFHDATPGLTSEAFGALPARCRGQWHPSSYAVLAAAVPPSAQATRVLDVACGDGFLLGLLAARQQPACELHGVDLSHGELALARERLGDAAQLRQARAQELPYADGHFDCVLSHMALMLMDDAPQVLAELRRVMKPGGALAAIVGARPPASPVFDAYVQVIQQFPRQARVAAVRFGDARFRSREGLAELLAPGFRDLVIEEVQLALRLTPPAAWHWFLRMYDIHLMDAGDREAARSAFMARITPQVEADGLLPYPQAMRFFSAVRDGSAPRRPLSSA